MNEKMLRRLINLIMFIAYMFAILEAGTYGLFFLTLFGLMCLFICYFVLFGIVIWIDYLKVLFVKPKKKVSKTTIQHIDTRPIIEQLNEAFGKK